MITDLKPILERFISLQGVTLAMIVGNDGLVIESVASREYDLDAVGALATTGLSASQRMAQAVADGQLVQSILEFDNGLVILQPVGGSAILMALTEAGAGIGQVRLVARREMGAISQALES